MHSVWKGSLSFGLVNIPVKMYSASQDREFKFTLLHKADMSEIRYARICKTEEKEVPWKEIVKGFEVDKGHYIVFNEEDFQNINLKKTKTIEIIGFAKEEEIDSIYYMKPYFLEPDKGAERTYALLCEALLKSKKVGIAKYIIHNREHIAVVKPYDNALIINQLRYNEELLKFKNLDIPKTEKASPKEMEIALKLIDHLTKPFNPASYKDTYADEIKELIQKKAKGKKIQVKGKEAPPTKVHDIMALLKASLEQDTKKTKKKPSKKAVG
jgi:DNA end-binding protein Ku